jgi:hypothetical protein
LSPVFILAATRRFIAALPTPLLPLIKILSLKKAPLAPLKSKFRRCANSFNKIQTPFLPTPIRLKFYRRCKYYDQKFYHRQLYIKSPATAASSLPLPILSPFIAAIAAAAIAFYLHCFCRSKRHKAVRFAHAL